MSSEAVLSEKTLFDVVYDAWQAKFYLLFFGLIFAGMAFAFITMANRFYRAEMIIAPANHMGQGMQGASLIGEGSIRIRHEDLQSTAAFVRFESIYNGVSVASILVKDKEILAALAFDRAFEFSKAKTGWRAETFSEYLKKRVKLEPISGTSLRKLIYLHPDRKFAAYMIGRVHSITDEIIRARISLETNERIRYLNNQMVATNNPDHRRSLVGLLMEQERLRMMVSLDQPYAANVIEPQSVSSRPRWPDPYVIYPAFIFAGLFLGFLIFGFVRHGRNG